MSMTEKTPGLKPSSSKSPEQIQLLRLFSILLLLTIGFALGVRWALFEPKEIWRPAAEAIKEP